MFREGEELLILCKMVDGGKYQRIILCMHLVCESGRLAVKTVVLLIPFEAQVVQAFDPMTFLA